MTVGSIAEKEKKGNLADQAGLPFYFVVDTMHA
jgi:hypothetical protein